LHISVSLTICYSVAKPVRLTFGLLKTACLLTYLLTVLSNIELLLCLFMQSSSAPSPTRGLRCLCELVVLFTCRIWSLQTSSV